MVLPEWAFYLALVIMGVGLIGVILPIVPGVGLIWIVAAIYAIAERFATIDPITFVVLTILGAVGVTSDLWMTQLGAKVGGASFASMLGGMVLGIVGAIVGLAFLGVGAVPGAIIGAILGVVLTEWYQNRDWDEAFKVGTGWAAGCLLSGGVQFIISLLMILIFVWQVLRG
jgi:uncharacterized protein YqgC (DUF456 family)